MISMFRSAMAVALLAFAAALSGCSSTPEVPETPLTAIQAIQVGDDALDCDSLQRQIFDTEAIVARLTQQIESAKTAERTNDMAGAVNSYLGQSSFLNTLLASSARNSATDKREVRDSYQRRRDILLQQYMHKKCSVSAQPVTAAS